MKDFSRKRQEIKFTIDADQFEAAPAIPAEVLTEFVVKFSDVDGTPISKRISVLSEALGMVLVPESYELLKVRMNDRKNPVELEQVNEIVLWLLEQYGMRPTQPSSQSALGQQNQEYGMNLTDSAQTTVSTFVPSPQTVS